MDVAVVVKPTACQGNVLATPGTLSFGQIPQLFFDDTFGINLGRYTGLACQPSDTCGLSGSENTPHFSVSNLDTDEAPIHLAYSPAAMPVVLVWLFAWLLAKFSHTE